MEFFGRQDILSLLDKRVSSLSKGYRQNIAIIGEELIGKTYLIKHWLSRYCDNYIVPIYIEIKPQETFAFVEKFIGTFLFSFLKNSQIELRDDIDFLIGKAENYIPNTISSAKQLLSRRKRSKAQESFIELLKLTEYFYKETGKRCLIIFDEFHLLEEMEIKDIYTLWRKHIMVNKDTMYILLSSKKQLTSKILSSDLDLLFGNFEKIELQPFDNKTAQSFIQDKLKMLNAPNQISDFIINFASGKPFYINILSDAFINYHTKNPEISPTITTLISSFEETFIDNWGILSRRFRGLMQDLENRFKNLAVHKILIGFTSGLNRIIQLSHQLQRTKKDISSILSRLCEYDLISKNADSYVLSDKIFASWLKCIYANEINAFSIDFDKQRQCFKKEMETVFNCFCDAQKRAVSERIIELFGQFQDESIEVDKKRMRLNRFKEIKLLNINGKQLKEGILARAAGSVWIAGLKENKVIEEDMIEFIDVCRKFKYNKSQKRIFIAFDEIDINASLIAKEEKISTWDIGFINSLLDIYDKPRIVR